MFYSTGHGISFSGVSLNGLLWWMSILIGDEMCDPCHSGTWEPYERIYQYWNINNKYFFLLFWEQWLAARCRRDQSRLSFAIMMFEWLCFAVLCLGRLSVSQCNFNHGCGGGWWLWKLRSRKFIYSQSTFLA